MLMIVALVLDGAETGSAEAVELEAQLGAASVGADVYVRLFADADLVADGEEGVSTDERLQGQIVVPVVGQPVTGWGEKRRGWWVGMVGR